MNAFTVQTRDRIPANHCLPKSLASSFDHFAFALRQLQEIFTVISSSISAVNLNFTALTALIMEYHAVPPEERARDEQGNLLPWGYVYKEYVSFELAMALQSSTFD
jgi:hypothetical protein